MHPSGNVVTHTVGVTKIYQQGWPKHGREGVFKIFIRVSKLLLLFFYFFIYYKYILNVSIG